MEDKINDIDLDIVIPVYKGYEETKACIESVLENKNRINYDIVVVNDCSPDEQISDYLVELSKEKKILLIENQQNLGFVRSVNLSFALHPQRDIILLNSDTEVHSDWVDRLVNIAYSQPNVATVTPFSNNATICSYPVYPNGSELPSDLTLAKSDSIFKRANGGLSLELPTAIGFCMYIRRSSLDKIGFFDENSFPMGYGEENDFSRRAVKAGFINLAAPGIFVYHKGSISFGESKKALVEKNAETLLKKHPEYNQVVHEFFSNDSSRIYRNRAHILRMHEFKKPRLLIVTHRLGGGTEIHIQTMRKILENQYEVLILRPHNDNNEFGRITWSRDPDFQFFFRLQGEIHLLEAFIRSIGIEIIHIHHVLGFSYDFIQYLAISGLNYLITLHDYYLICPIINMVPEDKNTFCGADPKNCENCSGKDGIFGWKYPYVLRMMFHRKLLENASEIICPTHSVEKIFKKFILNLKNISVINHPESESAISLLDRPGEEKKDKVRIGILGYINDQKGKRIISEVYNKINEDSVHLELYLIGDFIPEGSGPPDMFKTGAYEHSDLPKLLLEANLDALWYSSICPETFSFTLSEGIRTGLPLFLTDIGAYPERVEGLPNAYLLSANASAQDWISLFLKGIENSRKVPAIDIEHWKKTWMEPLEYWKLLKQVYDNNRNTMEPWEDKKLDLLHLENTSYDRSRITSPVFQQNNPEKGIIYGVLRKIYSYLPESIKKILRIIKHKIIK